MMVCRKNSKLNETWIFAQFRRGRRGFFLDLVLEQALSMLKNCLLEIPQVSHIIIATKILYHCKEKFCHFFHGSWHPLRTSRWKIIFDLFDHISKRICYFLFLSVISEKQSSAIIESLKFTGSIYSILKSQTTISLATVSLTK